MSNDHNLPVGFRSISTYRRGSPGTGSLGEELVEYLMKGVGARFGGARRRWVSDEKEISILGRRKVEEERVKLFPSADGCAAVPMEENDGNRCAGQSVGSLR
jgi:hypothetical protein